MSNNKVIVILIGWEWDDVVVTRWMSNYCSGNCTGHTSAREGHSNGKAEKQARWRNGNTNGNMINEMKTKAKRVADTGSFPFVVKYILLYTTYQCKVMLNDKKPTLPGRFPWEQRRG